MKKTSIRKKLTVLTASIGLLAAFPAFAQPVELLSDGGFEMLSGQVGMNGVTNFTGSAQSPGKFLGGVGAAGGPWAFATGSAGLFQPSDPGFLASPLAGTTARFLNYTAIYQPFGTLQPDTLYTLSFDWQGITTNAGSFFAGVVFESELGSPSTAGEYLPSIASGDLAAGLSSTVVNHSALAGTSGSRSFSFTTSSNPSEDAVYVIFEKNGATPALIDNVSLTAEAVPEPSTGLLFGLGAAAFLLRRRKPLASESRR